MIYGPTPTHVTPLSSGERVVASGTSDGQPRYEAIVAQWELVHAS